MSTMKTVFYAILTTSTLLASAAAAGVRPPDVRQLTGRRNSKKQSSSDSSDSSVSSFSDDDCCPDPKGAVLALLDCVASEDSACAAAAYDPGFERFHNELFTGDIPVSDSSFWDGAFLFVDISFDIKFSNNNPEPNKASVRYVENVVTTNGENLGLPASATYPFGVSFEQHEHAIVTVDDGCKLVKWDQYGDNKEQTDVDDATAALQCALGLDSCVEP